MRQQHHHHHQHQHHILPSLLHPFQTPSRSPTLNRHIVDPVICPAKSMAPQHLLELVAEDHLQPPRLPQLPTAHQPDLLQTPPQAHHIHPAQVLAAPHQYDQSTDRVPGTSTRTEQHCKLNPPPNRMKAMAKQSGNTRQKTCRGEQSPLTPARRKSLQERPGQRNKILNQQSSYSSRTRNSQRKPQASAKGARRCMTTWFEAVCWIMLSTLRGIGACVTKEIDGTV